MSLSRRSLMLNSIALLATRAASPAFAAGPEPRFVSASRRADGTFSLVTLSAEGRILRDIPLSARGHDIAIHAPSGRAVAFARRPGDFAVAFETRSDSEPIVFTAPEGRHFFGHGAFSPDGHLLYVTENNIAAGVGVVGIYDVGRGYKKIGEHQSYGVGPHELILLSDGKTLAIANGGIDTSPEAGRENLNLDTMQPSLAFVDRETGALRQQHVFTRDAQRLSIRHIAADRGGQVWFGGQWEGDPGAAPGLIGCASLERALSFAVPDASAGDDLKDYIGSVAISDDGRTLAASAPKAGRIVYVDTVTSRITACSILRDACGLAPVSAETFVETSGFGVFRYATSDRQVLSEVDLEGIAFDNHLRRII